MIVYHGTENTFTNFDENKCGSMLGNGARYFYFTSNKDNAAFYGDKILTVELSLHNPRVFEAKHMSPRECADEATLSNFFEDTKYDGIIVRDCLDGCCYSDIFVAFEPEQARVLHIELAE